MSDSIGARLARLERAAVASSASRCECGRRLDYVIVEISFDGAVQKCPACGRAVSPSAPTKAYADIDDGEPQVVKRIGPGISWNDI